MLKIYQSASNSLSLWPLAICLLAVSSVNAAGNHFEVAFDERGVSKLGYRGTALVDLAAHKGDPFLVGTYRLGGRTFWGENDRHAAWDSAKRSMLWTWPWGSVQCDFKPDPAINRMRMQITVTNLSKDVLEGINVYPLGMQFAQLPKGFGAANYPVFRNGLDGAPVLLADYGTGSLTVAHVEPTPLYIGFSPSGPANHYRLQLGSINDESQGFLSRALPVNTPLSPGKVQVFNVDLRFAAAGAEITQIAADVLKAYGAAWPQKLKWPDRRPVGELFLTNATQRPRKQLDSNPRNYTFAKDINIHTAEGKQKFKEAAVRYASDAVTRLKKQNAQGVIVWDLEGQQYPQPDTSYVGDPASLARLAPEMEFVADEFFRQFTQAGLRCGVTIRPQRLDFSGAVPKQKPVKPDVTAAVLIEKMKYARQRWGCTIFYVDSDGGPNDATAPSVFATVLQQIPDALIIPENVWPKDYAYTAPLGSFTAPYKPLHTSPEVRAIWPGAFTVTYVGDAPVHSLKANAQTWGAFRNAVLHGDVLSFRAWFDDQPLNDQVSELSRK